jgi:ATP-dependent helicase/nuclease subunit B
MTAAGPRERSGVFTIPAGLSFVDALAEGLLARAADPLDLARGTVFLPTRRACRALQEAFLRAAGGRALLLPRLVPLGDLDAEDLLLAADEMPGLENLAADLAPPLPGLRRQLLLAELIRRWGALRGEAPPEDQALRLADELAHLLDQVETEGLDFAGLETLVPADYAAHWQKTLEFLRILIDNWPGMQAAEGGIGAAARARRLAELQAAAWRRDPPAEPVIVAGSTGSIPATAQLIEVVAGLPQGMVVLPGLDTETDAEIWDAVAEDPGHPQHGLARLLARLKLTRDQVAPWPSHPPGPPSAHPSATPGPAAPGPAARGLRRRLVDLALYPAVATPRWNDEAGGLDPARAAEAFDDVTRIDAPGPGEEAAVIALILRRALETPGRRAALVTPDRGLARRVAGALARWGVAVDDSAGAPLSHTAPGGFLRLSAEMMAGGLAPLALLAALKHPLAAAGQVPAGFRARVRTLERLALRGPRPAPGFAGLTRALRAAAKDKHRRREDRQAVPGLVDWLKALEALAKPFARALGRAKTLRELLDAHIGFAEALAATDRESGPVRLWAGEAGTVAANFVAELREAAGGIPAPGAAAYPAYLTALLGAKAVRPPYGSHPRLAIWGPLEARLQQVDLVVLGGLNEGTWPAVVEPGPWLSRPMRADFGLPPPERRLGLAAHDFAQLLGAPEVYLTRATRIEGAPSVPSRWLLRLQAVLGAIEPGVDIAAAAPQWLAWAEELDSPGEPLPAVRPAPAPPLEARPRRLSVTRIETWMRDPYDLYAERILKLTALDDLDSDPGAAELGTLVHEALEKFLEAYPSDLPADPEAELIEIGREVFSPERVRPGVRAFWWPRFRRIARWFAREELGYRAGIDGSRGELRGVLEIAAPGGPFTLTATADRIDRLAGGALAIVDYKTGGPPTKKEVALGFSPQLPLEAAIARAGGFAELPAAPVARLEYWRVSGGEPPGERKALKLDADAEAEAALDGLRELIARYDDPETPYPARPRPEWARRFSDYRHLARVKEWGAGEEEES